MHTANRDLTENRRLVSPYFIASLTTPKTVTNSKMKRTCSIQYKERVLFTYRTYFIS